VTKSSPNIIIPSARGKGEKERELRSIQPTSSEKKKGVWGRDRPASPLLSAGKKRKEDKNRGHPFPYGEEKKKKDLLNRSSRDAKERMERGMGSKGQKRWVPLTPSDDAHRRGKKGRKKGPPLSRLFCRGKEGGKGKRGEAGGKSLEADFWREKERGGSNLQSSKQEGGGGKKTTYNGEKSLVTNSTSLNVPLGEKKGEKKLRNLPISRERGGKEGKCLSREALPVALCVTPAEKKKKGEEDGQIEKSPEERSTAAVRFSAAGRGGEKKRKKGKRQTRRMRATKSRKRNLGGKRGLPCRCRRRMNLGNTLEKRREVTVPFHKKEKKKG